MSMKFQGKRHSEPTDEHCHQSRHNTVSAGKDLDVHSNSRPLSDFIESSSVRTQRVYNWKDGSIENKKLDVLTNAQRHINRLKVPTVTSNRGNGKQKPDDDGYGNGFCSPSIPTIGGRY